MFRFHKQAINWCAPLLKKDSSPFKSQMDLYYIFFMTGIGLGLDDPVDGLSQNMSDINRRYTQEFDPSIRYRIAGLFLVSELNSSHLPLNNKSIVKSKIEDIISREDGNTFLNSQSIDKMNKYAYNGFVHIRDKLSTAPNSSDFLIWFYNEIIPNLFKK